jgi:hypothetical protein
LTFDSFGQAKEWQKYFAPNPPTAASLQTKTTTPPKNPKRASFSRFFKFVAECFSSQSFPLSSGRGEEGFSLGLFG